MRSTPGSNFAECLVQRLSELSYLTDAATGETIHPSDLPRLIGSFGARLVSAGLKTGDRLAIGCALSPPSYIAYLGAMYAGLVPVPIDEKALASVGKMVLERTGARAFVALRR